MDGIEAATINNGLIDNNDSTSNSPSSEVIDSAVSHGFMPGDGLALRPRELGACTAFLGLVLFLRLFLVTNERPIPIQQTAQGDIILDFAHNEKLPEGSDTVPTSMLFGLAVLLPLASQLLASYFITRNSFPWDVHATLCTYLVAFALTELVTESVKCYVGYLRPSFYELCQPNDDYSACTSPSGSDARKSFPSGHASVAFTGLILPALFARQRWAAGRAHVAILSLAPVGLAVWIAASRVRDNKHFPADVVTGTLLGASVANYVHGIFFSNVHNSPSRQRE